MHARRTSHPFRVFLALGCLVLAWGAYAQGEVRPTDLRCDYAINPVGVEAAQPHLSWTLDSRQRNQKQTAWYVLVASAPGRLAANQGDLWDSGKVQSSESVHVSNRGAA